MATLIEQPTIVMAAENKHKEIAEYVGRLNFDTTAWNIARMKSPAGWSEPGQTPEFDGIYCMRGASCVNPHGNDRRKGGPGDLGSQG